MMNKIKRFFKDKETIHILRNRICVLNALVVKMHDANFYKNQIRHLQELNAKLMEENKELHDKNKKNRRHLRKLEEIRSIHIKQDREGQE